MIDASGVIQARYSYDLYGRRTKVSGALDCDFGFTGYYHHATSGLDLSATRPYDSNTGRFIQRDPSGEGSGLNLYAYCAGNPVNFTDLLGLDRTPLSRIEQGAKGGAALVIGIVALGGALITTPTGVGTAAGILLAVTGGISVGYGSLMIYGAFLPDTPANNAWNERLDKLPSSVNQAVGQAIAGNPGQIVGSVADDIVGIMGAENWMDLLSSLIDLGIITPGEALLDYLSATGQMPGGSSSPIGAGGGGGCIDSSALMTAPPMGLTPDGLRP